jgi:hypothetical protein
MSDQPFFTLTSEETCTVAFMCVSMTHGMTKRENTKKNALLTEEFGEAFDELRSRLMAMQDEKGMSKPEPLDLDRKMAFAMLHSIVQPFYMMKGHLTLPKEQRKNTPEIEKEIEDMFYGLKEQAADLAARLTEALGYLDYGLKTLEEIFDIKIAERPLQVDNEEEISTISVHEQNRHLFQWVYTCLDTMKPFQDDYEFAYDFYHCQFFHLSDYNAVREKLKPAVEGEVIDLTLRDCIVLYYTLSLAGKYFVNDVADFFDEMAKKADAERTTTVDTRDVRNFFLKVGDAFMSDMVKGLRKNKTFMLEISKVQEW